MLNAIRKVDACGKIMIPAEIRRMLDIFPGDTIEVAVCADEIIMKKAAVESVISYHVKCLREIAIEKDISDKTEDILEKINELERMLQLPENAF